MKMNKLELLDEMTVEDCLAESQRALRKAITDKELTEMMLETTSDALKSEKKHSRFYMKELENCQTKITDLEQKLAATSK